MREFGIENCGFLTLTVAGKAPTFDDLQAKFNSLRSGVLAERYVKGIWVVERGGKSGRLHMHGVIVVGKDIKTDVDVAAIAGGDYTSANVHLRSEWAFWRKTAPLYGFGRTELLPIKTTTEAVAAYVGSYINKHVLGRWEEDKGRRFVRYVGFQESGRKASGQFCFFSSCPRLWARKKDAWGRLMGYRSDGELREAFGPRWAYIIRESVMSIDLVKELGFYTYPTAAMARIDGHDVPEECAGPVTIEVSQTARKMFTGDPIWLEKYPPEEPPPGRKRTAEELEQEEARKREMRLYAARIKPHKKYDY